MHVLILKLKLKQCKGKSLKKKKGDFQRGDRGIGGILENTGLR
jgi:hypothetical protein